MTSKNDAMNELYTAAAITAGLVAVLYASKNVVKVSLGVPSLLNGLAKLLLLLG